MQHDLVEVLRNLRFARLKAGNMINDPMAIPGKTLNYASLRRRPRPQFADGSAAAGSGSFERLVAKVMSLPARRFLRSRRVSFLAGSDRESNVPVLLRGTYQSPILYSGNPPKSRNATSTSWWCNSPRYGLAGYGPRDYLRPARTAKAAAPRHFHSKARFR